MNGMRSVGRALRRQAAGTAIMLCSAWLGLPMNRADAAIPDGVTIDVRVDEGILEASELRDWVDEAARSALEALPDQAKRRGTVRIMVDGALYDYRVTLEARQGDRLEGDPRQWDCKCSNGELLDRLQDELPPCCRGWSTKSRRSRGHQLRPTRPSRTTTARRQRPSTRSALVPGEPRA